MGRILAVAINTFREAVRDRVLYGVLGIATAVLAFTMVLAELSLDQRLRIVLDVGLASISLFSVLISIFLGSSLMYKEIERKTLYVILPKPIQRHEFLVGKYLGIALTVLAFIAIQGAVQLCVSALQGQASPGRVLGLLLGAPALLGLAIWRARDRTAVVLPWSFLTLVAAALVAGSSKLEILPILAALALTFAEVLMLTAVATLFSSFSTPFLTGLLTLGVWIVGRSADVMATMQSRAIPAGLKLALKELSRVWPNFNLFVPGRYTLEAALTAEAGPLTYVANGFAYALAYATILLVVASLIWKRRDFI